MPTYARFILRVLQIQYCERPDFALQQNITAPNPYKLRYIVGFRLVDIALSTNPKPTIHRNLY